MDSTVMWYDQQHKVGARTKKKLLGRGGFTHLHKRDNTTWKNKLVEHPKPSQPWWCRSPDPAAWQLLRANILVVPSLWWVDRGRCQRFLVKYVNQQRKKLIGKLNALFYILIYCLLIAAETMHNSPPCIPLHLYHSLVPLSNADAYFWLVVVWLYFKRRPSKANM